MKTSAELQRQSYFRKLLYFGLILVLFTVMTFYGTAAEFVRNTFANARSPEAAPNWLERRADGLAGMSVARQSRILQLNESDQGQADLAGSTARLSLSGARGFAICFLWISTIEKQKKHEWNEVEMRVNTITKLQPHFLTPWLFQSWNLSYNVSVEADRVRDKYFYISKGISLLAEGERINRYRGIDKSGDQYVVGNPDMRFWIAFYYSNKFGSSDEQQTLRSLFQMSCINPAKRHKNSLRPDDRNVDMAAFREFVQQNPLLCRRLRDYLGCAQPEQVVDFLIDNFKIPNRYDEVDQKWVLKRRPGDQFPVLPDEFALTKEAAPPHSEVGGDFESYRTSWAWHVFAQEPLPQAPYGKPIATVPKYDPLRYRIARAPAYILFRNMPARALSYYAERLLKEGWFDDSGWVVDDVWTSEHWFEDKLVVGNNASYSSQEAWKKAYQAWDSIGREHGYLLTEADKRNLNNEAELFRNTLDVKPYLMGPDLVEEQVLPEIWKSYDAHQQLLHLQQNLQMTNFRHHLYRAEAEKDDRTIKVRRLLFQAHRLWKAANRNQALARFEEAFRELIGDAKQGRQGLLEAFPDFRNDNLIQEELLEKNFAYVHALELTNNEGMHSAVAAASLAGAVSPGCNLGRLYSAYLYKGLPNSRDLPSLFLGPLEGKDSRNEPWTNEANLLQIKGKLGLIRRAPNQPLQNAPALPSDMPLTPQP